MSTRFCSWIVPETEAEHHNEDTEDSKSLNRGRQGLNKQNSDGSRNNSKVRRFSVAKFKAESPLPRSNYQYEPLTIEPESPVFGTNSNDGSEEGVEKAEKVEKNETSEEELSATPDFSTLHVSNKK